MKNLFSIKYWALGQQLTMIFIFILIMMIISCNKDDDELVNQLPKATQTGENIFACLINEKVWIANDVLGAKKISLSYDESGNYIHGNHHFSMLSIGNSNRLIQSQIFHIDIEPVIDEGQLSVNDLRIFKIEYSIDTNFVDSQFSKEFYELDKDAPIKFEFSNIDTINNICSGIFEFQLQNLEDSLDVISVTNGRFDTPYRTY